MRRLPGFELCSGKEPLPATANLRDLREIRQGEDIDVRGAYNLIGTTEGNEFKTAFRTRSGQFEYRVMPSGLTNAPARFQAYMDDCLRPYMVDFAVYYLDDILISIVAQGSRAQSFWRRFVSMAYIARLRSASLA
jgi:hypothetical protein